MYITFSRQLAAHWFTATGILMSASSIHRHLLHRELRAKMPLYWIFFTENHWLLRLQWAHERRAWEADWHQVIFLDESHFNLWDRNGCFHVRRFAGQHCIPECVIEGLSDRIPVVMAWGTISYHGRANLGVNLGGSKLRVISIAIGTSV